MKFEWGKLAATSVAYGIFLQSKFNSKFCEDAVSKFPFHITSEISILESHTHLHFLATSQLVSQLVIPGLL